jgi:hypothetical protein
MQFPMATVKKNALYSPNGSFDYEEDGHFQPKSWRLDSSKSSLTSLAPRKPSQEAKEIRQEFAEYFITNGAIEWQNYVS